MSLGKSSSSSTPSTVWSGQSPYLENLYSNAQNAFNSSQGGNYAQQFVNSAGPASQYGLAGGMSGQLAQNPYLQQMASGQVQNQALGGAIQAGLGDINRNFQRNIMPGINTGAAMTNTSGGSRQGIAQGLAMSDANSQASDFVSRMLSNNFQGQMQNQLGAFNQMGQSAGQADTTMQNILGMSPELANLGYMPEFGALNQYASLLGAPTVLGGSSNSSGWNVGFSDED